MTLSTYQGRFVEYSIPIYFNRPALCLLLAPEMAVFGLFCESYDMSFISTDDVSYVSFLWRAGLLDMYFTQNLYVDN